MALSKEKTLPSGITASYWRICQYHVYRKTKTVEYCISLFLNQSQTVSLTAPKKVTFQLTTEEMEGDIVAIGYQKIKEFANTETLSFNPLLSQFSDLRGSTDV